MPPVSLVGVLERLFLELRARLVPRGAVFVMGAARLWAQGSASGVWGAAASAASRARLADAEPRCVGLPPEDSGESGSGSIESDVLQLPA